MRKQSAPTLRITSNLPRRWPMSKGTILQADVPVNFGRMRLKLLVFDTLTNMRSGWKRRFGDTIPWGTRGAVRRLCATEEGVGDSGRVYRKIKVDERYFAVMGLLKNHLTMKVISHECAHAAFAFEKRRARSWWDERAAKMDEEAICYPTGEIAAGVVRALEREGLLP